MERSKKIGKKFKKNSKNTFFKVSEKYKKFLEKPLVFSYSGHREGIKCIETHPYNPNLFFSGSLDGEIRFWFLNKKNCIYSFSDNDRSIRGLTIDHKGKELISCSDDGTIKKWDISAPKKKPKIFYSKKENFNSIKAYPFSFFFATGGKELLFWDQISFQPIQRLFWGTSSISKINFNPNEPNILASLCSDRSIILFDLRLKIPIKKIFLEMTSNDLSWNFGQISEFAVANEDSNVYIFDLRNTKQVKKVYRDHVMSVNCIEQDSKGQNFISGSSDTTVRLFKNNKPKSFDIFFTKRMKKILDIRFLHDEEFFITSSDDGNLRIWTKKTKAMDEYHHKQINKKKIDQISNVENLDMPKMIKNLKKLKKILLFKKGKDTFHTKEKILPGYLKFNLKGFKN
ncbi:sof1 (nucleomorph) [Hemiselmis andersenii]|uniref:Sof1 n=1 Tax=Hemiselmis andersenii TaxID=464988 RepID=A9BL35_HEMAN|nr:sof1 [Hemiselmis andersenii]ABW98218.1 sof1 [Hemiselmis andersenii]|mmetsp:Transcript_18208/g.43744  ORF Transcript_18208/g.43744 Transcript_18208/m.43744 type:complete len:399 (-) Transcript_18208:42-1238(-)